MFSNTAKFIANRASATIIDFVAERGYDMPVVTRTFVHNDLVIELECDFYGDIVITADNDAMTIKGDNHTKRIVRADLMNDNGVVETDGLTISEIAQGAAISFMNEFEG